MFQCDQGTLPTTMTDETESSEPRYSIAWTPGGDLVFRDGPRKIEMGHQQKRLGAREVEVTVFAKTIKEWRYPYSHEPITDGVLEHILTETKNLLEQWGAAGGAQVLVKINRTD